MVYGFSRPTGDLDVLEIAPKEIGRLLLELGMRGGPRKRPIAGLLPGNDLRGLSGWGQSGQPESRNAAVFDDAVLQVSARRTEAGIPRRLEREGLMSPIGPKPVLLRLGCSSVRGSSAADPASRRLAMSIVWRDVEPGSSPQTVSQPLWPRLRREPDHALLRVSFLRSRTGGIARGWQLPHYLPAPSATFRNRHQAFRSAASPWR
jgi:hypothetical protein